MPEFTAGDGVPIHFRDDGQGDAIVLVHGWMMSHRLFGPQSKGLASSFRLIAPDLRGCGESGARAGTHNIPRYAKDLGELLDHLGIASAVLVGWSMGGGIVMEHLANATADRVRGVGLVDFPPVLQEDPSVADKVCHNLHKRRETFVRDFVARMFLEPRVDLAWIVEEALRCGTDTACEMYRSMRPTPPVERWGHPATPAWLAFPEKGWFRGALSDWRKIFPRHHEAPFSRSKHCPFLEEPEAFNASLEAFARSCF